MPYSGYYTPSQFRVSVMTTSRWPLYKRVFYLAAVNFLSFVSISIYLGGDALNGYTKDGHYFVSSHGWHTEVSRAVWIYSYCHAISVFVTFGLVPVFLIIGACTEWDDPESK